MRALNTNVLVRALVKDDAPQGAPPVIAI